MAKIKNNCLFLLYSVLLGSIIGLIIWAFLRALNLGIGFLWEFLPDKLNIPFYIYAPVLCTVGGFLIGIFKKKAGDYPENLNIVLANVKQTGRYPYHNIFQIICCALFPLLLGASIGPEAGLTGVIAGLCTWVGDKLKRFFNEVQELTTIGVSATLGTIFKSPMFGFMEPLEEDDTVLPKRSKIILYFATILSSFGVFILLNKIFHTSLGMESLRGNGMELLQYLWIIPLTLIGIVAGILYVLFEKLTEKIAHKFQKNIIIRCTVGGLLLGTFGAVLPLTMFSGEHQITEVAQNGASIGAWMLIVIGVAKLLLTNICIQSGLKGGHFFPVIFAGVAIGMGASLLIGIDPVFSMCVVTAALVAFVLKKPLATVLLLMIIFSPTLIPFMICSAIISCFVNKLIQKQ